MAAPVRIGTCSFADDALVKYWYPRGLPATDRLGYYAERFSTVEIDSTFYRVPDASIVRALGRPDARGVRDPHQGVRSDDAPSGAARAAARPICATGCRSTRAAGSTARRARPARWSSRLPRRRSSRSAGPGSSAGSSSRCRPTSSRSRRRSSTSRGRATSSVATRCSSSSATGTGTPRAAGPRFSAGSSSERMSYVTVDAPRLDAASVPQTVIAATGPLAYVRFHGRNAATWIEARRRCRGAFRLPLPPRRARRLGRAAPGARRLGRADLRVLQQQQPDRRRRAGPGRGRAPASSARGRARPGRLSALSTPHRARSEG